MDMCKNVEIIKARISDPPDLFLGGNLVKDDGQDDYELPRNLGLSILPNSNNAVFLGDSLIISEPGQNSAFARLLLKIFQT